MSRMLRMSEAQLAGRKPSKYKNVKKTVNGIAFDSTKEATRYMELKLLEHAGEIHDLKTQPVIKCMVNGILVCSYLADFAYTERGIGQLVYEDVKSKHTRTFPVYRLKKKLVYALFGIEVREV